MKISFDLDEVLFVDPETFETEPPLSPPFNYIYRERLRKGTVYLINELQARGFEVWVYTSSYRSIRYIRSLFAHYHVKFDGIINMPRHLKEVQKDNPFILPQKMPGYYRISLHVDDEDVIAQNGRIYGFKTIKVCEPDDHWTERVLETAEHIRDLENARENGEII